MSNKTPSVIDEIAAERERQITKEGRTPHHDDRYNSGGQLAKAAACYAFLSSLSEGGRIAAVRDDYSVNESFIGIASRLWPPGWGFPKLKDRRRDLVRGAALIIAEIERLDRKAANQ